MPSNKEYIKSEQTAVCTSIEFNFIINLADVVRDETASEIIYLLELKCPYCMSECSRVWPEWYQMSTESDSKRYGR